MDLTRQALAKYSNNLFFRIVKAYQLHDAQTMVSLSQEFLELVNDIDTLLACHEGFLLGPWLQSAKKLAQNEEEEKQVQSILLIVKKDYTNSIQMLTISNYSMSGMQELK